jgi:hypothetical protein
MVFSGSKIAYRAGHIQLVLLVYPIKKRIGVRYSDARCPRLPPVVQISAAQPTLSATPLPAPVFGSTCEGAEPPRGEEREPQ